MLPRKIDSIIKHDANRQTYIFKSIKKIQNNI